MLLNTLTPSSHSWSTKLGMLMIGLATISLSGCVVAHSQANDPVRYGYVKSQPSQTVTTTTTTYQSQQSQPSQQATEQDAAMAMLDSALAPIALYPDSLLEHIFAAVTQPVDLIQARAFIEEHATLEVDELLKLAEGKPWDASVIALLPFADVITNLTEDLEYLEYLGDVVEQEYDLVAQRLGYLREQAQRNGNLQSDEYVKVIEKETKIYIESAQPEIIYLPTYNPVLVYGSWWHSYQPRLWHYSYLTRYPRRYNNYGPRVGVHISTGNVAISWNPFRYVRHNYWRDRYDIKTRHQIFSRRLQTSHYSHNVHRRENWGQNHIKSNNRQQQVKGSSFRQSQTRQPQTRQPQTRQPERQQPTKQRPKIKDRPASSQFTKRVPVKQSVTRSNQAINQNTNRPTKRTTNQPVKTQVRQTYNQPIKQAPKQPSRVKNRNVVSQSSRQPARQDTRQETRPAPKRPTVEKNVNKPSYNKQR
jgi:hypothetical protein